MVDDPVISYVTHDEEMVKRAKIVATGNMLGTEHYGPFNESFVADRGKVWDIISQLIIKKEAWLHIKHSRTSRDGRKSMLEFHDHFLVPNSVDHIQKQA